MYSYLLYEVGAISRAQIALGPNQGILPEGCLLHHDQAQQTYVAYNPDPAENHTACAILATETATHASQTTQALVHDCLCEAKETHITSIYPLDSAQLDKAKQDLQQKMIKLR